MDSPLPESPDIQSALLADIKEILLRIPQCPGGKDDLRIKPVQCLYRDGHARCVIALDFLNFPSRQQYITRLTLRELLADEQAIKRPGFLDHVDRITLGMQEIGQPLDAQQSHV